jgi:hypothetical protein
MKVSREDRSKGDEEDEEIEREGIVVLQRIVVEEKGKVKEEAGGGA